MNPTLWIVASSMGGAVLIALAVVYRRAAARRELELAEELLEAEYRELGAAPITSRPSSQR